MDDKVKALLEQVRGAANYAADAAADGARAAGRRAGQILRQLGQVMVDTHKGQAAENAVVTGLLNQADEKAEKIAELKGRISDLKQSQSCPDCGEPCGKNDKFCRACGAKL